MTSFSEVCFLLWSNSTYFEIDKHGLALSSNLAEFSTLWVKSSITKIHMQSYDPVSQSDSTTKAIIYYMDPTIAWTISAAWEFSFSYVTIRSDRMVDTNCNSELCRH